MANASDLKTGIPLDDLQVEELEPRLELVAEVQCLYDVYIGAGGAGPCTGCLTDGQFYQSC